MPDESFKDYVLDQLSTLPEVRARAMFGGHGVYQGAHFFAILVEGRLYFKTDAATRRAYEERGMEPFTYEQAGRMTTMHYFEVPPDVLEDRAALVEWAKCAVAVAAAKPKNIPRAKRQESGHRGQTATRRGTARA
jgi:DNA transformation protein